MRWLALALVCGLQAQVASGVINPPKHKPWKMLDRMAWNDSCVQGFKDGAPKGVNLDLKKVHNLCDCVSGILQDKMSIEEYGKFDHDQTKSFIKLMTDTIMMCLQEPV